MRVISGKVRGLKLISPEGTDTRPTLDRVKEAIFSMLLHYLNDSVVLDLFAGSGALGIEALSRGAQKAVFVDNSPAALKCIDNNISNAKFKNEAVVVKSDAANFLKVTKDKFDIIFLDPPYSADLYSDVLNDIYQHDILSEDGIILVEWDFDNGFQYNTEKYMAIKEKKYGRVGISILKKS